VTGYLAARGPRTGVTLWRVQAAATAFPVVPDGVMDLVWSQDRLIVAGPDTRSVTVMSQPGEVSWGLQFAPGVAHALLGLPADELTDRRVELADLVTLPDDTFRALENDPWAALEQIFVALWDRADPDPQLLRRAAALDHAARDGVPVREVVRQHDVSERSLRRMSNAFFGYGLKTLAQVHRFHHALRLVRSGTPLGEAAATAGYVDQAHFTRESRKLTGQTPAALRNG